MFAQNTTFLPANQFPHDYNLRMRQTTSSILPFDIVSRIIKEADGGLDTHKKKFRLALLQVENMVPYRMRLTWDGNQLTVEDRGDEAEGPWEGSENPGDNIPAKFPQHHHCTTASLLLRDREPTELELYRVDWWCPEGGGASESDGGHDHYQHRFQSWIFHPDPRNPYE